MSDGTSQSGWWVASDGKWYPPADHPDPEHRAQWAEADDQPTAGVPEDLGATAIVTPPSAPPPPAGGGGASSPPPPPSRPTPSAPPPSGSSPKRKRPVLWVAAVVVFAVVLVGAIAVLVTRNSTTPAADAATVQLEPVGFAGDDPFATNMTVHEVSAFPDNIKPVGEQASAGTGTTAAAGSGSALAGTTPGLYGGTNDTKACDPTQLKTFLRDNPDKGKAWAAVQGLSGPAEIDAFVDALTPVVLTTDTRVTNHGFKNGKAIAIDAVLQRGTAVMVDATGTPRVKCACGNPLLKPAVTAIPVNTRGTAWPGYTINNVITIQPGTTVTNLQIVNIQTGQLTTIPVGATQPGVVVALEEPGIGPEEGRTNIFVNAQGFGAAGWEKAFHADSSLSGVGFGDGKFLAVGSPLWSSPNKNQGLVFSADATGKNWAQIATIPNGQLHDVAFGDGRWLGVGSGTGTSPAAVFESKDGKAWTKLADVGQAGVEGAFGTSIAFGDGRWVVTVQDKHEPILAVYSSNDGKTWTRADVKGDTARVGFGQGAGWLMVGTDMAKAPSAGRGAATSQPPSAIWKSTNGTTWNESTASAAMSFAGGPLFVDGQWYGTSWNPGSLGMQGIVASADGATWSVVSNAGTFNDIAVSGSFKGGSSGPTTPTTGTPTTTAPGSGGGGTTIAATGDGQILRNSGGPAGPTWEVAYKSSGPFAGVAFGNGSLVAVGGKSCKALVGDCKTSAVHKSDPSGKSWNEVGTIPEVMSDLAFGSGKWIAVGSKSDQMGQTPVEYESTDLVTWKKVTPKVSATAGGTADGGFTNVAFADGKWVGTIFYGMTALGAHSQLVVSTDGVSWQTVKPTNSQDDAAWARGAAGVAHGDKGWLAIGSNSSWDGNGPVSSAKPVGLVITSTDGSGWKSAPTSPADVSAVAPVFSGGTWYAASNPFTSGTKTSTDVLSSTDGTSWTKAGTITIPAGGNGSTGLAPVVDMAVAS